MVFVWGYGITWDSGSPVSGSPYENFICFLGQFSPMCFFSAYFSVLLVHGTVEEGSSEILILSWLFSIAVCGK